MDLTNLRDSLDSSSKERHPAYTSAKKSELRLTKDFKAAALQLTTLYRTSLSSAKRSYASGYTQSLHDILDVVLLRLQQSPSSAPGIRSQHQQQYQQPYQQHLHQRQSSVIESDRDELKWLIRYLRARIEAIKAESEEEEEKESEEEEEEDGLRARESKSGAECAPKGSVTSPSAIASSPTDVTKEQNKHELTLEGSEASKTELESGEQLMIEPESVASVAPPSSTLFNFTPPSISIPTFPTAPTTNRNTPQGSTRRKIKNGGMGGGGGLTTANSAAPVYVTPASASSVSSEEETRGHSPQLHTPSKRSSNRLGKRSSGRDKSSALDLFGKAINAKRRRGMGDRRDEDRRDGGLH